MWAAPEPPPVRARHEKFFEWIQEKRASDPLICAKEGGEEVVERVQAVLRNDRGVHFETALCIVAALAGYACQAGVREAMRRRLGRQAGFTGTLTETEREVDAALFTRVDDKDGQSYFFGDRIDEPLDKAQHSVFALIVAGARKAGCEDPPRRQEVFAHCMYAFRNGRLGRPRDFADRLVDKPIAHLRAAWPKFTSMANEYCPPEEWPILFGMAVQGTLAQCPAAIDPFTATRFAMDIAVAMSRVDLAGAPSPS
jgi:hypothetical protein